MRLESSSAIILGICTILAILAKNSSFMNSYDTLVNYPVSLHISQLSVTKPALIWVNELLMAVFFLVVGLELKREILEGHLASNKNRILPAIAALGGIIVPATIYAVYNWDNPIALKGWAVPAATDIAFAIGILSSLGKRLPPQLKICLLSIAIFDDIVAVLIIAIFYTANISFYWLLLSIFPLLILITLNHFSVQRLSFYIIIGSFLWICILKSGVHATIAGIVLAFFIPIHSKTANKISPLTTLEQILHPWVSYIILPTFAFFNAGITVEEISARTLTHPVFLGIVTGLFLGKQLGVMLFSVSAVKLKWCSLPENVTWLHYYGMALITGIGFTMSIFIGMLAFSHDEHLTVMRLGVMLGSLLSGVIGYIILLGVIRWYR